jgi:peroxiredoxin
MKAAFFYSIIFLASLLLTQPANANRHTAIGITQTDTMLHEPAPDFTLKDTEGKSVSLSDFKGKILVIDFWATWCVPCKKSFPEMQMAINHYKNDPGVKFIFIDTWEKSANYMQLVKKFMADNPYTFKILFDEMGPQGIMNEVYNKYEVNGIPTKFIIDSKGIICFEMGYLEKSPEDGAKQISDMIEAVRDHD